VAVAPLGQRHDHGVQVPALVGQPVGQGLAALAGGRHLQHAAFDQAVQPLVQHVRCNAQARFEFTEALAAEEGLAHDQQRPPLPDQVQGAGNRATLVGKGSAAHGCSLLASRK